jgi:hypothetical protein
VFTTMRCGAVGQVVCHQTAHCDSRQVGSQQVREDSRGRARPEREQPVPQDFVTSATNPATPTKIAATGRLSMTADSRGKSLSQHWCPARPQPRTGVRFKSTSARPGASFCHTATKRAPIKRSRFRIAVSASIPDTDLGRYAASRPDTFVSCRAFEKIGSDSPAH